MASGDGINCILCRYPGSDIRLLGCGCTFHARCTPLSLVLDVSSHGKQEYGAFPPPNTVKGAPCTICRAGRVEGIALLPLTFGELERASELRRAGSGKKSVQGSESPEIHAQASFLLLSNNRASCLPSGFSDREQQRTGRWTDEEIAYVDLLVAAFDQGSLPLPQGIKLNEFLGDMLVCKSSRLTKKMKNAKLSTRSFVLGAPNGSGIAPMVDYSLLSTLQEKFLQSVTSEPTQLELRFNLTKQWRTHFSNLCIQVGYPYLEARDWVASLEEMERRASAAEEMVRKVRRKRMGIALQTDGGTSASSSVFIGGVQADAVASQTQSMFSLGAPELNVPRRLSNSDNGSEQGNKEDDDMFSMLDAFESSHNDDEPSTEPQQKRPRTRTLSEDFLSEGRRDRSYSEDFESVLRELMVEPEGPSSAAKPRNALPAPEKKAPNHSCGPFLDAITMFMESKNLPFQHADVWVPSFMPRETKGPCKAVDTEQLRLFHAGYATRGDLNDSAAFSFHEFGVYSDNFSFEPGHGLPGRVYTSGQIAWDRNIDQCDPKHFERAGGAKVYGVKTAVGIPLNTPMVGRIVVAMYSQHDIPENLEMAQACAAELMRYSPEPKWKLVIEMNNDPLKPAPLLAKRQDSKHEAGRFGNRQVGLPQGQGAPKNFPSQLGSARTIYY